MNEKNPNFVPVELTDDQMEPVNGGASIFVRPKGTTASIERAKNLAAANLQNRADAENDNVRAFASTTINSPRPRE